MSKISIVKINGVEDLNLYLQINPHLIEQLDDLLSYFPIFNVTYGQQPVTKQILEGHWMEWQNVLHTVILINETELVGFGQILIKKQYAEIFNLIIKKEYRHQGLGHQLLNQLETIGTLHHKQLFVIWCEKYIQPFYLLSKYVDDNKMQPAWNYKLHKMVKYMK